MSKQNLQNNTRISEENRTHILQDLDSSKPQFMYDYHSVSSTSEYFKQPAKPLAESFKSTLEAISGICTICKSQEEVFEQIKQIITNDCVYCNNPEFIKVLDSNNMQYNADNEFSRTAKYSITSCEALVTRTASVLVSSEQMIGRRAIAAPEIHIVIATENQLFEDFPQAFVCIENKFGNDFPSQITSITGPSRTADIEKTLVLGAHGPKQLIVFIIKK